MNDQNAESVVPPIESKPRLRDRFFGHTPPSDVTSKPKPTIAGKAKNVAAVIGVVTVVIAVAAVVTKRKSVDVELTLPDVDISTESA